VKDVIVIVQARMGSTRLPGKTMKIIENHPMLWYLIQSVLNVFQRESIVIATSSATENDVIRNFARQMDILSFSGDEDNVAERYLNILKNNACRYMFRICGDSPYYDSDILLKGMSLLKNDYDIISSMPNKGYPMGCNLEVIKSDLFIDGYSSFEFASDYEHVMPYFYRNLNEYKHKLISCDYPGYDYFRSKFSVDVAYDFILAEKMLHEMKYEPWNYTFSYKMDLLTKLNP
jgi:spore coat polysaccharide biosynthesis protein SpsF